MTARRLFVLFGARQLVAMVAWIGEIDLGIEDSVLTNDHQANPPGSTPTSSKS